MAEVIATAPSLRGSEPGEDEAISEPRLLPPHYRRTSRRCFGTQPRNDGCVMSSSLPGSLLRSDEPFRRKTVKFSTLGCRLNQYETQAIREQFLRGGYEETGDAQDADVFVLNTCSVTSESDRQSRYLIRRFHRSKPEGKVVVTGCYAERNREEIEAIPGVTLTVLNREKSELYDLFERHGRDPSCLRRAEPAPRRRFAPLQISHFEGRSRAYVKVQDGCNHACSFCKVVLARGPSRSRPVEKVVEEARRLVDDGYLEVVLTGIQLGAYGYDLRKRQMLVDLLGLLPQIPGLERIRLSSIEPTDVTDELISSMASNPRVCPHLHIPLQSGADQVLERMNRRYRRSAYTDLIHQLRGSINNFVLTTDVMIGFPGETSEDFEQTVEVLEETEPYKLHIFPFSPREGTRAARFQNTVASDEVRGRRHLAYQLEKKLRRRVQERFLGHTVDVLAEETRRGQGWTTGRSRHYLKVRFSVPGAQPGLCYPVRMTQIEGDELLGYAVADSVFQSDT